MDFFGILESDPDQHANLCGKLRMEISALVSLNRRWLRLVFLLSPHDSCFQISECVATVPATLKFTVKDCDPTTGEPDSEEGYSDDYQLEDIDITVADYVQRVMKV